MKKFNGVFVVGSEVVTLDEALRLTDNVFFTHDGEYVYLGKRGDNAGAMSWIVSGDKAMEIGISAIDVDRLESALSNTDVNEMVLVHHVGYQWVRTEKRNNRELVPGYNRDYFNDAVAFLIPKRTNLRKLNHRSLDWMIKHFS